MVKITVFVIAILAAVGLSERTIPVGGAHVPPTEVVRDGERATVSQKPGVSRVRREGGAGRIDRDSARKLAALGLVLFARVK